MPHKGIRVTVEDLETGESESQVIRDDYVLVSAGSCYLEHTQAYANGTHVLTVKGRRPHGGEQESTRQQNEHNGY